MHRKTIHSAAFTVVELLVTIGVSVILITLIGQIFNDATQAVSIGMQKSELLSNAKVISDQLRKDAEWMIPPSTDDEAAGFLVIVNRRVSDIKMPSLTTPTITQPESLRVDQLYFIRKANMGDKNRLSPISPSVDDGYGPDEELDAEFARVFYGHLDRTNPDGSTADSILDPDDINANGWNWLLGRQALLLKNGVSTFHVEGIKPSSQINSASYYGSAPGNGELFRGLHDVSDYKLYSDGSEDAIIASSSGTADHQLVNSPEMSAGDYQNKIRDITFIDQNLQANPIPEAEQGFEPWQIGQMHPVLMEGVSEFEIAFAGDYALSSGIDRTSDTTGEIIWYGDGDSDTPFPGSPNCIEIDLDSGSVDGRAYIFRHDKPDDWPYMIRIRFRLHDLRGRYKSYRYDQDENEGKEITGRWFEVIIPVNRGS